MKIFIEDCYKKRYNKIKKKHTHMEVITMAKRIYPIITISREFGAIHKQALEKVFADIPFVSDQLAIYEFYEGFVFQWFPVIHISVIIMSAHFSQLNNLARSKPFFEFSCLKFSL